MKKDIMETVGNELVDLSKHKDKTKFKRRINILINRDKQNWSWSEKEIATKMKKIVAFYK